VIIWQTSVALLVLINWLIKLLCAAILHHVQASANGAIRHLASQLRTRTTVRRSSAHMCAWCMAILWAMMPTARNLKRVDGYAAAHHQDVEWSCNPSSIMPGYISPSMDLLASIYIYISICHQICPVLFFLVKLLPPPFFVFSFLWVSSILSW
jgi:hypothetical protein